MKVKIYTTPACTYCHVAMIYFGEHGVEFEQIDVRHDKDARAFMLEHYGSMGVPVIVLGEHYMVGWSIEKFEKLQALVAQSADAAVSKTVK